MSCKTHRVPGIENKVQMAESGKNFWKEQNFRWANQILVVTVILHLKQRGEIKTN